MSAPKKYWLLKSEPGCFSIDDLAHCPKQTTHWDGVRNYQARNYLRDQMHVGDGVLFYHSGAEPPAIAGTARVAREAYPDHTALLSHEQHFDPKSTPENPIWMMVDIQLDTIFPQPLPLDRLRKVSALEGMELLRKGSRLSVQPVTEAQWNTVLKLAKSETAPATPKTSVAKKTAKKSSAKKPKAGTRAKSPIK